MIETLANGYSSESTQRELSNEYQHDRVQMVFRKLSIFVLWMKVDSALEGLILLFLPPFSSVINAVQWVICETQLVFSAIFSVLRVQCIEFIFDPQ